ncbi:MAG: PspA/IM30 family protein [Gammaproteobacteria bacterium]|nr:PspA/IM30 family protein [Gammaproteobacteria bacterium]MDH5650716.1 PspA/IM30 family protein [Gammaproteobacteria bacterium]
MPLINRITRLFRADMHAVLDKLEEPEALLRQAVREMEESIAEDEQRLKRMELERSQLQERHKDRISVQTQLEEELDICFKAENQTLAKSIIRRKLEAQRHEKYLVRKTEALTASVEALQKRLTENQSRLQSMQQKLELLSQELATRETEPLLSADICVTDDEVEVAFLRELQQRQPA